MSVWMYTCPIHGVVSPGQCCAQASFQEIETPTTVTYFPPPQAGDVMKLNKWDEGFAAGVLSALACIGEDSTEYREIVRSCNVELLLSVAERDGDSQLPLLREIAATAATEEAT
jgi:hypothetical protein